MSWLKSFKADIPSITPSLEQMIQFDEGPMLEMLALKLVMVAN